jgi:hypothetical protein
MLHRRIGRALAIVPDDDILAADAARHPDQADDGAICAAASASSGRPARRALCGLAHLVQGGLLRELGGAVLSVACLRIDGLDCVSDGLGNGSRTG